jgi:Ca2+-binding EF-hand superfamily protein
LARHKIHNHKPSAHLTGLVMSAYRRHMAVGTHRTYSDIPKRQAGRKIVTPKTRLRARRGAAAVVLGILFAAPAAAQQGNGGFTRADSNGDGRVTLDEATDFAAQRVEMLDRNDDGVFTESELRGWVDQRITTAVDRRFDQRDTNGDGRLTSDEFTKGVQQQERAKRLFQRYDVNADGALSRDEMRTAVRERVQRQRQRQRDESQQGRDAIQRSFQALDANGDGRVTREEAVARAERRFEQRDTDGDGVITPKEGRGSGGGQGQQ